MQQPKWIAFDMYTTLMDREAGGVPALQSVMSRKNINGRDATTLFNEWHYGVIRRYRTRFLTWKEAGRQSMDELGARYGIPLVADDAQAIYDSFPSWPTHPDTVPVLKKLKERYKLAVVTNMDTDLFRATRLGVELDGYVTSEMAHAYKPSPAIFDYALKTLGCARGELLWAGTAIWADVMGARLADLTVVWIKRRMGRSVGAMELEPWDPVPDYQFDGLAPLLDLLKA